MLIAMALLSIAVYFVATNGFAKRQRIEQRPVVIANELTEKSDAEHQTELSTNSDIELNANSQNTNEEEQHLVSVQYLIEEKKLNISVFNEKEILVLRKYMTDFTVPDEDIDTWFGVFSYLVFLDGGEKRPDSLLSEKVDNNWVAANAYNHDIKHWEDISAEGDVIATGVLAYFYETSSKFSKAEYYFQKLFVNAKNKRMILQNLVTTSFEHSDKKAAAYVWYGIQNSIDIPKSVIVKDRKNVEELLNQYSEKEIAVELEMIERTFENLHVNYANSETTNLKDIFN